MKLTKKQIKKYAKLHIASLLWASDNCGLEGLGVDFDSEIAIIQEIQKLAVKIDEDCVIGFGNNKQILDFILKGKMDETE